MKRSKKHSFAIRRPWSLIPPQLALNTSVQYTAPPNGCRSHFRACYPASHLDGFTNDDITSPPLDYESEKSVDSLTRILLGMHDYGTGLDLASLSVTPDFENDGIKPGENLAAKFEPLPDSRWGCGCRRRSRSRMPPRTGIVPRRFDSPCKG